MPSPGPDITRILDRVRQNDAAALEELLATVYDELKVLAEDRMRRERDGHTLQPTALVHEAYLRLVGEQEHHWQSRLHFFGAAAEVMRRILVEHARGRGRKKRGGDAERIALDDALIQFEDRSTDLLDLDAVLRRLADQDERHARIVELRFFGGLQNDQVAELLGVSARTVERDWKVARLWLLRELERGNRG